MTVAELHELLHRDLGPELAARVILTMVRAAHGETIYVGARILPKVGPNDTPAEPATTLGHIAPNSASLAVALPCTPDREPHKLVSLRPESETPGGLGWGHVHRNPHYQRTSCKN